jgi:hypothetical protein
MSSANVEAGQRATAETGFRSVIGLGGCDIHTTKLVPALFQATWLASRYGLPADRAKLLAELAFTVTRRRA